jgi:hypothetical protein
MQRDRGAVYFFETVTHHNAASNRQAKQALDLLKAHENGCVDFNRRFIIW